ncbi:hypothetical protein L873DRAFT_1721725 [Choiromyces venosus 120613-1]|uniref:Uncharacterized protein n=1 Tax=Choiromyces venosus 120613-1 TaxID=1336337 RepID=A0A3N4J6F9_9PEZI|nr:hypothetical protein L873DRAFT_1721725 [Choiromyces venosus 120613-1]
MLRTSVSKTLLRSSSTLFTRASAQQARLYDEGPTPHATEKKHGLDTQSEQSQRGMKEKAESSMSTEARGQKHQPEKEFKEAPGPIIGMQDERGGSMSFVYPPVWNSFGMFVGA